MNPVAQSKTIWVIKKLVAKKTNLETTAIIEMCILKNFAYESGGGSERNRHI